MRFEAVCSVWSERRLIQEEAAQLPAISARAFRRRAGRSRRRAGGGRPPQLAEGDFAQALQAVAEHR